MGNAKEGNRSPEHVWVVVGPSCSGKTECGRYLQDNGFRWFEASKVMLEDVPLEQEPSERLRNVESFLLTRGRDYVARQFLRRLAEQQLANALADQPILITGFRTSEEVALLRKSMDVSLVAIEAPLERRYQWALERARPDCPRTIHDFIRLTAWEYSLGLARLIYESQLILHNTGTLLDLVQELSRFVRNRART